jgi:hypothetical protein
MKKVIKRLLVVIVVVAIIPALIVLTIGSICINGLDKTNIMLAKISQTLDLKS